MSTKVTPDEDPMSVWPTVEKALTEKLVEVLEPELKSKPIVWSQEVVLAAKTAAVAMANLWDLLRVVEGEYGVEFDGTLAMIDGLAAECNTPASMDDLDNESVRCCLDFMDGADGEDEEDA